MREVASLGLGFLSHLRKERQGFAILLRPVFVAPVHQHVVPGSLAVNNAKVLVEKSTVVVASELCALVPLRFHWPSQNKSEKAALVVTRV